MSATQSALCKVKGGGSARVYLKLEGTQRPKPYYTLQTLKAVSEYFCPNSRVLRFPGLGFPRSETANP